MGASSAGARSLARMVAEPAREARFVVSLAKGLETDSGLRMSEVYVEEIDGPAVVAVGGPCLAGELAQGLPSATVWAAHDVDDAHGAGKPFEHRTFQIDYTDDVVGLEYCSVLKNVAAIGMGMLDGLGEGLNEDFKNAKAALFAKAIAELSALVVAKGGRAETASGLAGLGDTLVTSLGGRNRLYGEQVGAGRDPQEALRSMEERGLTVEGVDSARTLKRVADEAGVDMPYHLAITRVLFDAAEPTCVLDVLL